MRKRTFSAVCSVLALLVVLAMGFFRVKTPHNIPFFVIYLGLMPLFTVALTPLNNRLLIWRRVRNPDVKASVDIGFAQKVDHQLARVQNRER